MRTRTRTRLTARIWVALLLCVGMVLLTPGAAQAYSFRSDICPSWGCASASANSVTIGGLSGYAGQFSAADPHCVTHIGGPDSAFVRVVYLDGVSRYVSPNMPNGGGVAGCFGAYRTYSWSSPARSGHPVSYFRIVLCPFYTGLPTSSCAQGGIAG